MVPLLYGLVSIASASGFNGLCGICPNRSVNDQSGKPCPDSKYPELNSSGSKSGFATAKETNNELKILIFTKIIFKMHFTNDFHMKFSHQALSYIIGYIPKIVKKEFNPTFSFEMRVNEVRPGTQGIKFDPMTLLKRSVDP